VVPRVRVQPEFREAYVEGRVSVEAPEDPTDVSFFYALASGEQGRIDAAVMGAAERAWQRWIEGVCLDDQNGAFEVESSPFADRPAEVLRAIARPGIRSVSRARDLSPFLRRPGNRDCQRILARLELWFLRQYDVHHAAVMRHHAERLRRGAVEPDRVLSGTARAPTCSRCCSRACPCSQRCSPTSVRRAGSTGWPRSRWRGCSPWCFGS
jgi:hypothetical protein